MKSVRWARLRGLSGDLIHLHLRRTLLDQLLSLPEGTSLPRAYWPEKYPFSVPTGCLAETPETVQA